MDKNIQNVVQKINIDYTEITPLIEKAIIQAKELQETLDKIKTSKPKVEYKGNVTPI